VAVKKYAYYNVVHQFSWLLLFWN